MKLTGEVVGTIHAILGIDNILGVGDGLTRWTCCLPSWIFLSSERHTGWTGKQIIATKCRLWQVLLIPLSRLTQLGLANYCRLSGLNNLSFLQLWSWKVQVQSAGGFGICWWPSSWFSDGCLHAVSSHGVERERERERKRACANALVSFYKGINLITCSMLRTSFNPNSLPKAPPLLPSYWVLGLHK